jgi:hypothetical protein
VIITPHSIPIRNRRLIFVFSPILLSDLGEAPSSWFVVITNPTNVYGNWTRKFHCRRTTDDTDSFAALKRKALKRESEENRG